MMNIDHLITLAREINVEIVDWDREDKKTNLFEYIQEETDGRNNMRLLTVVRGGDIHKEFDNLIIYYHAQDLILELENVRKKVVDLKKAYRDALIHVSTFAQAVRVKVERKVHDVVTRTLHQDVLTLLCIKYELLKKPFNLITEVDKAHDGWLELSRNVICWDFFCRKRNNQRHGEKKIPKDDRPASWVLGVDAEGDINVCPFSEKITHSLLKMARLNYKENPDSTTIVPKSVADINGKKWSGIILSNVSFTSHHDKKVVENQFDAGMWELFGEETRHFKGEGRTFLIFNNERRRNDALMWLTRPVK